LKCAYEEFDIVDAGFSDSGAISDETGSVNAKQAPESGPFGSTQMRSP